MKPGGAQISEQTLLIPYEQLRAFYKIELEVKQSRIAKLEAEVERLKEENKLLRASLIKSPDELHCIAEVVTKMGFPKGDA